MSTVITGTQATQDIYNALNADFSNMNALADGLANQSTCVTLPNMPNGLTGASAGNMTIDASSLGPGQLFAVSQAASNTDTKDQVATIAPTKLDGIEKSAVRDAKS